MTFRIARSRLLCFFVVWVYFFLLSPPLGSVRLPPPSPSSMRYLPVHLASQASTTYLDSAIAYEAINAHLVNNKHIRLIVILREPVSRAYSHYQVCTPTCVTSPHVSELPTGIVVVRPCDSCSCLH